MDETSTFYPTQSLLQGNHTACFLTHASGSVLKALFIQEPRLKDYYFLSSQLREHIMIQRVAESTCRVIMGLQPITNR